MTFVLFGLAVVIIIKFGLYSAQAQTRKRLARAPRVTIAAFPEATPARIVGRVVDGERLTSPLCGRPCVFYEVIVQQRRQSSQSSGWRTIIHETRAIPFAIDDGTGHALVDPEGATLVVVKDASSHSGAFDDATPAEEGFLARHNLRSKGWLFNKKLRYREGALEIGETIAVCGVGVREPDPDGAARVTGYRDAPPTRLRLARSARSPLLISDFDDTKA